MERLTVKAWRNLDPWECCGQDDYCQRDCHSEGGCNNGCIVPKIYDKLARYEDAEEQGRLIILPHKIGDRVFLAQRGKVRELEIKNVTSNVYYTQDVENGYRDVDIYPNDFGRYVFHSREEAEKALEE